MHMWAILFMVLGLIAGLVVLAGGTAGVWTFALLIAFVVLLLSGLTMLLFRRRGGETLT